MNKDIEELHRHEHELQRIRRVYSNRDTCNLGKLYSWHNTDVYLRKCSLDRVLSEYIYRAFGEDLKELKILDVGCGIGGFLRKMVEWGATPSHLTGTEILQDRLDKARLISPEGITWHLGDLDGLINKNYYELVTSFTVLSSILDDSVRCNLLESMWGRVKPGGWILIFDLGVNNPSNNDVRKVTRAELENIIKSETILYRRLVLAPPIARRLSNVSIILSQIFEKIPLLRTHFCYMARK